MNSLEMFKRLTKEDIANIKMYYIYDIIYENAKDYNVEIPDKDVVDLREVIMETYDDELKYGFSLSKVADFITSAYLEKIVSIDELRELDPYTINEAIDNDNMKDLKEEFDEDMER